MLFLKLSFNPKLYLHLFLGWFLLYFLFAPGKLFTIDSHAAAQTARALTRGHLHIPENYLTLEGPQGNEYFRHALLWSFLLVPGDWVAQGLEALLPDSLEAEVFPQGSQSVVLPFYNHAITALILVFLFHFLCRLKVRPPLAFLAISTAGLCSLLLPYSRDLFRQPLAGFLHLLILYFLWDLQKGRERSRALFAGIALGAAILNRYSTLAFIPLYILGFAGRVYFLQARDRWKKTTPAFIIPILIGLILHFFSLWWRWADPFYNTMQDRSFDMNLLISLPILFFSPKSGLLSYFPLWILLPSGFIALWVYGEKWLSLMIPAVSLAFLLLYGKFEHFLGGVNPGPRYLLPLIPIWFIPLGGLLQWKWKHWSLKTVWGVLALYGLFVNTYESLTNYVKYSDGGIMIWSLWFSLPPSQVTPWKIDHLCTGWWPYLLFRSSFQTPAWIAFLLVALGAGYFLISAWRLIDKPDTSPLEEGVPTCRKE